MGMGGGKYAFFKNTIVMPPLENVENKSPFDMRAKEQNLYLCRTILITRTLYIQKLCPKQKELSERWYLCTTRKG